MAPRAFKQKEVDEVPDEERRTIKVVVMFELMFELVSGVFSS